MKPQVEFAGFVVSAGGYRLSDKIYRAISEFPEPQTKTDVRSFNGMANQLAPTHVQLSRTLEPLRELTKKHSDFEFTEYHRQAFKRAKELLLTKEVISFFRPGAQMRLITDASCLNGLGFVLMQQQPDRSWKPIQVGSRKLTDTEKRYAPIEIELKGVTYAIQQARTFLKGANHYTIITDHKPLVNILNKKRLDEVQNERMLKMILTIIDEPFTVEWIKGELNHAADCFSRHPVDPPTNSDHRFNHETENHLKQICSLKSEEAQLSIRMQRVSDAADNDPIHQQLCETVRNGFPEDRNQLDEHLRSYWNVRDNLLISEDGFLLYGHRLVIPKSLRSSIIKELHQTHRGIDGTQARARLILYWPGIDRDIATVCANCELCQRDSRTQQKEPIRHMPRPSRQFQYVSADLFSACGHSGVVYTDWYSGWFCYSFPLASTDAEHLIQIFRKWFTDTAAPDMFFSDQGPPFTSREFRDFLERWGVSTQCSSAYYPQGNNFAELAVKNCKSLITKYYKGPRHTDYDAFAQALLQVRNTPHKSTGISLSVMLYRKPRKIRFPRINHTSLEHGTKNCYRLIVR
jgi:hypothetical protein